MRKMKKIVIIGANDFQKPLILKAKEMGYETHVFAWREGATGAEDADYFYEISIVEKDEILKICQKIQPDAVATIGSDLANITVQYLAEKLCFSRQQQQLYLSFHQQICHAKDISGCRDTGTIFSTGNRGRGDTSGSLSCDREAYRSFRQQGYYQSN